MCDMRKTIYIRLLAASMLAAFATACVKDDTFNTGLDTTEGRPCTVTLNIGAASASEITVTRADNSLSRLSSIMIFVYDATGTLCQDVVEISNPATNGSYSQPTNETLYKVSFETTTGEKQLLAVANYYSDYWDLQKLTNLRDEAEAGTVSLVQLRDGIISLANNSLNYNVEGDLNLPTITAPNQMLISGWNTGVKIARNNQGNGIITHYGDYGDENYSVAIKMQRSMARIIFNITAEPQNANGVFYPSTFRVYNIPKNSYLAADTRANADRDSDNINNADGGITYTKSALTNIDGLAEGKYSFTFYIPENVQETKEITQYNDRDMWDSTGEATMPQDKKWSNAPANSTFVVIYGTFASNDGRYTGNVNYTVHLGDFSDAGSMGNFSVERNCSYTYNMSVLDVNSIIVEARTEIDENQNGAEGDIYDAENCVYNYILDAHYEQVYLEYNLSDIAKSITPYNTPEELDKAIADRLVLVIQSEAMDHNANGVINKRGSLKPYQIYVDAITNGEDPADKKSDILDGAGTEGKPTKGFDYKWVEFYPQSGSQISSYPGVPSWNVDHDLTPDPYANYNPDADAETLMDAYDVCVALGKAVKKLKQAGSIATGRNEDGIIVSYVNKNGKYRYIARFTAFVNEYYYYRHPLTGDKLITWSVLTNKIPREMIIAMSTDVSADGNSSYSQIYSYISQLSMQTFYNSRNNTNLNAFGIETYNETPLTFKFGNPGVYGTLDDSDGRSNQIRLLSYRPREDGSYGSWNTYINVAQNGWYSTTSVSHDGHKLNESAYQAVNGDRYAYYACLSRNRDLNGNGYIDDNEVRWHLASVNEYIRMGIGSGAISNAAQLYIGDKSKMVKETTTGAPNGYPSKYISDGSLYYTSSENGKRVYWAVEKGSYGSIDSYYDKSALPIRCVRVLPAITAGTQDASAIYGIKADPTVEKYERNGMIILNFKNRLMDNLYRGYVEGSLGPHNEDDDENSFYDGIMVAKDYLRDRFGFLETYKLRDIIGADGTIYNPCETYSEGQYTGWRVPNLVELSAMNAMSLLSECYDDGNSANQAACCTQFSNQNVRFGFARSSLVFSPGANGDELDKRYRIRCVRDVPAESMLLE